MRRCCHRRDPDAAALRILESRLTTLRQCFPNSDKRTVTCAAGEIDRQRPDIFSFLVIQAASWSADIHMQH
jgi:hypothetical protein